MFVYLHNFFNHEFAQHKMILARRVSNRRLVDSNRMPGTLTFVFVSCLSHVNPRLDENLRITVILKQTFQNY